MKRLIGILVVLAAIGAGAWYFFFREVELEKAQVVQAAVSQGDIVEQVQATGTLEALRTVQVGSPVSGTVQNLYADFNSIVEAGQVIARIDPSLLQVQVDIQTANIERQETDINQQRVQLENDERSLTRTKELFEKGLVNQTQLEQADLTVKARKAQIASAEKMLVQARANLNQAKLNLSYTEIKSPINGVVVNRIVDVGQTVQASTNTPQFFTIAADLRLLKLTAGVDEADIGKIQPNMRVNFTVDSYAGQNFTGTVSAVRLNAQTTNNVVTYPVWIDVPNVDLKLRPSMTANVRITIQRATGVIRVPNQALRFRPTSDMWTALGLTPPAAAAQGEGRRGRGADAAGETPAANAQAAGQRAGGTTQGREGAAASGRQTQPQARGTAGGQAPAEGRGQAAAAGDGRSGGGQGRGGNANMTPEERERLRQQFQAMGGAEGRAGRGGRAGGRGGAGGRGAGAGQQAPVPAPSSGVRTAATASEGLEPLDADKIDELFEPVPVRETPGTVWTWDEAKKELTSARVVTGLTDGQFSALLTGSLTVGQQLVTSVIVPQTAAQRQQNIFGQQGGRGGGGLQPGGLPGGGGGFGGGGQPGGGGGARGGGGGRGN